MSRTGVTVSKAPVLILVLGLVAGACDSPQADDGQETTTDATELTVMVQGEDAMQEHVVPALEEQNISLAMTPALSAESLAQARAEQANPQTSVFLLDHGPWELGKEQGLWGEIDSEAVPHLSDIPEDLVDEDLQGVAYALLPLGLIYNSERLEAADIDPPTSYSDLKDSRFAGHISIPGLTSTFGYALLWHLHVLAGGDSTDPELEIGFQELEELRPNVRQIHGASSELLNQLIGDDRMYVGFSANDVPARLTAEGESGWTWVPPEEGAPLITSVAAVAQDAPNYEAAMIFINEVLSPEFGKPFAELEGTMSANPGTIELLDPAFVEEFWVEPAILEEATLVDFTVLNDNRDSLTNRYQREFVTRIGE